MKNLIVLVITVFAALGFQSCEKTTTPESLKVTVNSPAVGSTFNNGNALNVNITFTDPIELHTYTVMVSNETDTTTVLSLSGHDHSTTLTIDTTIILNVTDHSNFKLHSTISNSSGDIEEEHVHFHVMP